MGAAALENVTDIMLDLETLGTAPGCAILAIGALAYHPRKPWEAGFGQNISLLHRFVRPVSLESCLAAGLAVEAGSLRFWLRQPREAQDAAFCGEASLAEAAADFIDWFRNLPSGGAEVNVWAHGATFDPGILARAFEAVGLGVPWEFRRVRDTRTAFDMAGINYKGTHHTVEQDCLAQCEKVCEAYGKIGLHTEAFAA